MSTLATHGMTTRVKEETRVMKSGGTSDDKRRFKATDVVFCCISELLGFAGRDLRSRTFAARTKAGTGHSSVQPRWNTLINSRHKPRNRMFRGCKHDFVLKNMIKIDVPATIAVKDGDGSIAIYIGYEIFSVHTLMHLHGHTS